ncbi:MAG: hypothetical protein IT182_16990 [Acidobacteria bacterium]|nr:hypothetical protein [Acidobacteriota bacterium]
MLPLLPGAPVRGERLRTLAGLAPYACAHAGSCCRAGWPIPIDPAPLALLERAAAEGHLTTLAEGRWADGQILGRTTQHVTAVGRLRVAGTVHQSVVGASRCVFHAPDDATGGCRLERSLGPAAMPFSCRQFPRLLLHDATGWSLSFSAWCPTAARLIVTGASGFSTVGMVEADPRVHIEGLDATAAWPPLLRPGVLAGHDEYTHWERTVLVEYVDTVHSIGVSASCALAGALAWTDVVRRWSAGDGTLLHTLSRPPVRRTDRWLSLWHTTDFSLSERLLGPLTSRISPDSRPGAWPEDLTEPVLDDTPLHRSEAECALARYVGTRLMGSWVAYQGTGLRSVLASLVSAHGLAILALSRLAPRGTPVSRGHLTNSIRAADWLLLHLLDRQPWADWCSSWEAAPDAGGLVAIVAGGHALLDGLTWT